MADSDLPKPIEKPITKAPEPVKKLRYVVEQHHSFEVLGSTITFREHQVLTDPREIQVAFDNDVPLRELTPIR